MSGDTVIRFWNGNKSPARREYETELLKAVLSAGDRMYGPAEIVVDDTDYPRAEDEGRIFLNGTDLLVTVAGNGKFADHEKIVINRPIAKGLLGYRLLIIRKDDQPKFTAIRGSESLRSLIIGIPATWADAQLFRANHYPVCEGGSFGELFMSLQKGEFDYCALGANEVEQAFESMAAPLKSLCIEPGLMLYYPFPLVFYVHPRNRPLAERIEYGLAEICRNGRFDALFAAHYGEIADRLNLRHRVTVTLENPILPHSMADFSPTLLD